ncbi:MAG: hypothetical protein ACK4GT_10515 [Pararhodobacter sp.]
MHTTAPPAATLPGLRVTRIQLYRDYPPPRRADRKDEPRVRPMVDRWRTWSG